MSTAVASNQTVPISSTMNDPSSVSSRARLSRQASSPTELSQEEQRVGFHEKDSRQTTAHGDHAHHLMRTDRFRTFWDRLNGKDRKPISWRRSLWNAATSSTLNVLLIFVIVSWISHFLHWKPSLVFAFSLIALIPMEHLFHYGGKQMTLYLGSSLGDLVIITLMNGVEATLGIILLTKCELRLLHATVAGVVILQLLLVPGTTWFVGGTKVEEQNLHPHVTQLNHALLSFGVISLLVPAAFFSSINRGTGAESSVTDAVRGIFLQFSRGTAIILLIVYIASRIFLHNPPGDGNALDLHPSAPAEAHHEEKKIREQEPELNPWFCIAFLIFMVGIMAVTAEWLVSSLKYVIQRSIIQEEWFGLILLPLVSYSGDAILSVAYFVRRSLHLDPPLPETLAKGRAIDLSIQFTLFWLPFLVILAWWINSPLSLVFDIFEVAVLIGACFLVNYITADAKTNWAEGFVMISFYAIIALVAWFYPGSEDMHRLLACGSVLAAGEAASEASH